MFTSQESKRYNRHLILPEIGVVGQEKLKSAKVLVVGAGGLGCPVLQYICAAGVGTIGIIDFDYIDESNLQRQILFNPEDIGQYKAEIAQQKLTQQNPYIQIISYCEKLTIENALELFSLYDLIVDGTDNFSTRYLINDACVVSNKAFVSGSIHQFVGQVSVFNYENGPTYRCLYPEPPGAGEAPNCAESGVIGVLPGICGSLMANEVIKLICKIGEVLSGKLLLFDALNNTFSYFDIPLVAYNKNIRFPDNYEFSCEVPVKEITAEELQFLLQQKEKIQLIDVREENEFQMNNIGGELIPLKMLLTHLNRIEDNKLVVVHCQSGIRSQKAVRILSENGFNNVVSLKGGLTAFLIENSSPATL